ncbi:MAG: zinc dependent phospholipase C family protein [Candidatus Lindowbacteria bacterium]|nr:zinc dependent phospholipase C family protein [Candidatus Lindowbacteria bacterium]
MLFWKKQRKSVARKLLSLANYIVLVASWVALLSDDAFAWGAGMHVVKGAYILDNLHLILPSIAQLLRAFPRDFLYGCISADFFIGKGHRRRDDHCHNWSVGLKMLASTETPPTTAFAYGYLAHLAADIIAHNYYIPNQLYLTSATKRLGHVYWEFRSDSEVDPGYWELARRVVEAQNHANDASLENAVRKKIISFKTKKSIYVSMLNLTDLERWRRASEFFQKNSRWEVSPEYIKWLRDLSISLAIEFLRDPKNSVCLDYDPVGTRNITRAKKLRRTTKRQTGASPVKGIFDLPTNLTDHGASPVKIRPGKYHLLHIESSLQP